MKERTLIMSITSKSVVFLFVIVTVLTGTGLGLHRWLTLYYLPVRDVEPILTALQKNDTTRAGNLMDGYVLQPDGKAVKGADGRPMLDSNRIHIRGRGEKKIKQLIFDKLNHAETPHDLRNALGWLLGIRLFNEPSDGEVLEKAVARYNAQKPASSSEGPWSVTADPDGYYYVQMGWVRSQ